MLAARLSEDPARSVCLVEAGPDYGPYASGDWPADMVDARSVPTSHDWGYTGGDYLLSARILGGCSAHNACLAIWGSRADYDEWEAAGGAHWSYAAIEPCMRRVEAGLSVRHVEPAEVAPWHRAVLEAGPQAGLPLLEDVNGSDAIEGVGLASVNAVGRVRWNTAFGYLDPARERSNLSIVPEALVERVVLDGSRATGAVVRRDGRRQELAADLVVLACGAFGSPAVLMLSGIGPEAELRRHSIAVQADLPGVGAGMVDHSGVSVFLEPSAGLEAAMGRHDEGDSGFQAQTLVKARSALCPEGTWDLHLLPWWSPLADESGAATGRYEVHFSVFAMKQRSRGSVRLRSADPEVTPLVEQGFLSDAAGEDLAVVRDGVALARRLAATEAISTLIDGESEPGPGIAGEEAVDSYVAQAVRSYFHPTSTCAMGPDADPLAVVDGRCRVHGFENLVVADAAAMPTIPRANTNLSVAALAERVAELF